MGPLEGGCLCGAVRYRLDVEDVPADVSYCHCRMCRRASGAPVVVWATVPREALRWTAGEPVRFASSAEAERGFCGACGTALVFARRGGTHVDVTVASLDHPERVPPRYHIWTASQLPWLALADALPRHADRGPDAS